MSRQDSASDAASSVGGASDAGSEAGKSGAGSQGGDQAADILNQSKFSLKVRHLFSRSSCTLIASSSSIGDVPQVQTCTYVTIVVAGSDLWCGIFTEKASAGQRLSARHTNTVSGVIAMAHSDLWSRVGLECKLVKQVCCQKCLTV